MASRSNDPFVVDPDTLSDALLGSLSAWEGLPVGLRLVAAQVLLAATNQRVNASSLAARGHFDRTAVRAGTPWWESLEAARSRPLALLDLLAGDSTREVDVGTAAAAEVAARDKTIGELREELRQVKEDAEALTEWALALSGELWRYREPELFRPPAPVLRLMVDSDGDLPPLPNSEGPRL